MDLLPPEISGLAGIGAGAGAAFALVRAVSRWIHARGDKDSAEAATGVATAKAVTELVAQMHDLRVRLTTVERELAEERDLREKLQEEVTAERERRTAAEKLVAVLEERLAWAEKRGDLIAKEFREWQTKGAPSVLSVRPPALKRRP